MGRELKHTTFLSTRTATGSDVAKKVTRQFTNLKAGNLASVVKNKTARRKVHFRCNTSVFFVDFCCFPANAGQSTL